MTPIEKAIAHLGGQTATGRMFDLSPQAAQQWVAQGRVPADHCPRIEVLTGVPCEQLNDRVEWSLIRGNTGDSATNHPAQLGAAIDNTRFVYAETPVIGQALDYLEQVLKADQCADVPADVSEPTSSQAIFNLAIKVDTTDLERATALAKQFNEMLQGWAPALAKLNDSIATTMSAAAEKAVVAMAAESAQLAIQAVKAAAGAAARATLDPVAVLSREVFSLSNKLQQPADLVAQLLVRAELLGMSAERSVATRGDKIVDSLCAAAASGTSHHSLEQLGKSLVAAVRAIPTDLAHSSNA